MLRLLFLVSLIFSVCFSAAQTIEGNNDCTYSKEIIIPFNYSSTGTIKPKHNLNQTVFYGYRDQFSFWYKIEVKENAQLSFKVKPINDSDEYAVYVYQYNASDFCNMVYYKKINPLKADFFSDGASKNNPYDLNQKTFAAKKDNVYYISVLNTSLNNCGHSFYLIHQKDTLKVKALHLPCKRELLALSVKEVQLKTPIKKADSTLSKIKTPILAKIDTVKVDSSLPTPNKLICKILDAKKKTVIEANLTIRNELNKDEPVISKTDEQSYTCVIEKGKGYKIKCTAFGYKNFEQVISFDKALNHLEILLEPLKEGDNFVMKSIYFYPNTYALKKASLPELQKLVSYLTANESITIEIQGHTNGDHRIAKNKAYSTLSEEWNFEGSAKTLSQKRAEAIKNYLENNGIKAERLEAKGYGGKKPIVKDPQTNEEGQLNIRVELVILKS